MDTCGRDVKDFLLPPPSQDAPDYQPYVAKQKQKILEAREPCRADVCNAMQQGDRLATCCGVVQQFDQSWRCSNILAYGTAASVVLGAIGIAGGVGSQYLGGRAATRHLRTEQGSFLQRLNEAPRSNSLLAPLNTSSSAVVTGDGNLEETYDVSYDDYAEPGLEGSE